MRIVLFAFLVMCMPLYTHSAYDSGSIVSVEEALDENYYGAGEEVRIKAPIDGDVFVAGRTIIIDAPIRGDLFVFAQDIKVNAAIGGDVRGAGESIHIGANVSGEVILAGNRVNFQDTVHILGDAHIAAEHIDLSGSIDGNVKIAGGHVNVVGDMQVGDEIHFYGMAQGNVVGGDAQFRDKAQYHVQHSKERDAETRPSFGQVVMSLIFIMLTTLLYAFITFTALRKHIDAIVPQGGHRLAMSFGLGIILLLLAPPVALVFLVTGLGALFGGVIMVLFFLMVFVALPVTAIMCGTYAVRGYRRFVQKRSGEGLMPITSMMIVIGSGVSAVLTIIPVIGPLALMIIFVAACGSLARNIWRGIRS